MDEAATEYCNCAAAQEYTFRKRQRERAYKKIKTMFEEKTEETEEIPEEITDILYASVDYLQDGKIRIDKTKTKKDVTEE